MPAKVYLSQTGLGLLDNIVVKYSWMWVFYNWHFEPVINASHSVILTHPDDRTVFLDDENGAFFSCNIRDSSSTHWRLNETDYDDLPSQLQDDLVISSISTTLSVFLELLIPARAEYNGTRVQCVAENDDGHSVVSDTATLTIQGIVNKVHYCL